MESYKHFIITMFNLQLWSHDKARRATRTDEWLNYRIGLFEQYCMPSVKAQTCPDFTWLVLLDADSPSHLRSKMETYTQTLPQLKPCYLTVDEAQQFATNDPHTRCLRLRDIIREELEAADTYIITTNLDSDDALSIHAVERLHAEFEAAPCERLVSFNKGIQYFAEMPIVFNMHYPHNHFMNLVERVDADYKTVIFYNHTKARKLLPCLDIKDRPYWMEIVHGINVNNELRMTSRIKYRMHFATFDFAEFGIEGTVSSATNLRSLLFRFPPYFLKIARNKVKRKINKKKQ